MWSAIIIFHNALRKEEVSKQGCDKEITSIQADKSFFGERGPCDCIGYGSEDPIQLSQWCPPIFQISWKLEDHVRCEIIGKLVVHDKISKRDFDGGSETRRENVCRKFRTGRELFVGCTSRELQRLHERLSP
jgi:hypothetical protein